MKFKFKAEPKDWIFFGIFCIVLLYFVAIAVLNLAQFAAGDLDKPFHGFNPFPAFTADYLGVTIIMYIAALIGCIMSVSDKFFSREKGLGLAFGSSKNEKGFSRWAEKNEYQNFLTKVRVGETTASGGGIPLINDGKNMWVDDGEAHSLILGSTGSGKTQMIILPLVESLAKHDESMIVTDPKGEIYEKTSNMLRQRGYNVVLLNFREPSKGSGWNPLWLPYEYYKNHNNDKANELIDDLAANILYDQNAQNQDPFWEKTSADYFSGLTLALFEDANEEEININSLNLLASVGEERIGPSTYIKKYFDMKDKASPAYVSASSVLIAPNETKGSILAVFKQKLRLFSSRENISEMLSHSDFDMKDIGRKKTAVFIIIQDEKTTYHPLVTIFIKQCYETLVDVAQGNGGKLKYRTNFILDEFANMPPLKDVETMVSAARSRNIKMNFVIQNFAQLNDVYGKEKGDTIKGNCTNIIYLISTEMAALEEISKMCGEIKVKTGKGDKEKEENRPLITVSDLQRMGKGEVIVLRTREYPLRTKLKYDYQINWGYERSVAEYPKREKQEIKTFDLKGFVESKNKEKTNSILEKLKGSQANSSNLGARPIGSINDLPSFVPKIPTSSSEVDDMLKRIDESINKLTQEEQQTKPKDELINKPVSQKEETPKVEIKKEKPKQTNKKKVPNLDIIAENEIPKFEENKETENKITFDTTTFKTNKNEEVKKEQKKPEVKIPKEDIKIDNSKEIVEKEQYRHDYVTDDQFFDDFFADED